MDAGSAGLSIGHGEEKYMTVAKWLISRIPANAAS